MFRLRQPLIIGFLIVLARTGFSEETLLLRYPDIHNNKIVFCYGGDIYASSVAGENVKRLTSFPGEELLPKFSPDGSLIAFTAEFEGNKDVYVMPAAGGPAKRLTYHPADEYVVGWHPDGRRVLFRSNGSSFSYRFNRLHTVPVQGGLPTVLEMSEADVASYNDGGDQIAFNRIGAATLFWGERFFWKGYRGGRVPDIWTYDFAARRAERVIADASMNRHPLWIGDRLFFVSDRGDDKTLNLYAFDRKSRAIRQVTFFKGWDVTWPSRGGDQIVFENEGRLKVYDAKTDRVRTLAIQIPQDKGRLQAAVKNVKGLMRGAPSPSPDGKTLLVCARGDLFRLEPEKNAVLNLTRTSGVNEKNPAWSPDGRFYAYISDISGEEQIYVQQADGNVPPRQISDCVNSRLNMLSWSPDGAKIGYTDQRATYYVTDVQTGKTLDVFSDPVASVTQMVSAAWSPDGRWLAYSVSNPSHFHVIHLYSLDRGSDYRVTDGLSEDIEPQFDPDGRYLYWISIGRQISIESDTYLEQGRTVDPAKIMALTLDKDAPAPFSDARELLTGREAGRQTQGRIDVEGLGSRITALPVEASNYSDLLALKGRLVYRSEPAKGEAALKMLDLADGKETSLPRNARFFAPAARADAIAYRAGDKIGVWDIAPDGKIKETPVDLSALTMTIDWRQEWRQIFDAAWRSARDLFFDERMNGVDWPAMKRKYERFLPAVASRADLNDLIGRMLGELRYAETGISGGDLPAIPPSRRGLLGVDLEMDRASRLYRIAKIFRGQNWDPERTSPLTLPGMNVKPGDYLLAIDGTPLREGVNPDALLLDKAGASVTLTIGAGPGRTGAREIKVKPAAFSSREGDFLRYNDWVLGNLDKVNKAGDGKIGYIHIPDTYLPGIESFYRYFMTQFDKQALIVDIRFNSGGYSPYWMLEFLNRRFMFNQILPYGKLPMAEPLPGHFGPKACIVNEWASSGGDMFAYTFKALQSGPLIGRRSSGSMGSPARASLIDGGIVEISFLESRNDKGETILHNTGVSPDIEVINQPDDALRGIDRQLERSVEELLKLLAEKKDK